MKTNFLRKPTKDELVPHNEFRIEKTIVLNSKEFSDFLNNPLLDWEFIKKERDVMFVDDADVWHCILVKTETRDFGILVESEGSSYARYAAYINLKEIA